VRASEEQALKRVEEKKRTARREATSAPDPRRQLRDARLRVERVEEEVAALEQEVDKLTRTLDDPGLYTRVGGVEEARRLGARLDSLRSRLDEALAAWERETAALETLERAMVS
jgi:predicted RNase H-like nuclease (RuvC/YqgF family)